MFNTGSDEKETLSSSQMKCFIDDLVIDQKAENSVNKYQIKDMQSLTLTGSPHAIGEDFGMQHAVCLDNDITHELNWWYT